MAGKRTTPDLTGQKFGKWTVLKELPKDPNRYGVRLLCRCECGTERTIEASELTHKRTTMCSDCSRRQTKRTPEEVREYMATHTRNEGARHFDISRATLDKYMDRYDIKAGKVEQKRPRKALTVKPQRKPSPERVAKARREFNVDIIPRIIPGVNDFSPHHERRWKYDSKSYLAMMRSYERMVSK